MRPKVGLLYLALVSAASTVAGQDPTINDPRLLRPDPINAVIEGRVVLPSGRSADLNIKVTLRNSQSVLMTLFTDSHGEFRFFNLAEGVYYIDAAGDREVYDPETRVVRLGRSQVTSVTMALRTKATTGGRISGAKVVSASEFDQQVPAEAKREYDQARKLIDKGKLQEAVQRLRKAVEVYPRYLAAHNDLGAQYLKLRRLDEAAEHFRLVLEDNPKYYNSRFNMGLVLIEQKAFLEAIAQLDQAVAIDSSRPAAHLWLGVALFQTGDFVRAERELSRALIMGQVDAGLAHFYLARIYMGRNNTAEALRALKAYLEAAPKGEHADEARTMVKNLETNAP